jgi:hypothetical protein
MVDRLKNDQKSFGHFLIKIIDQLVQQSKLNKEVDVLAWAPITSVCYAPTGLKYKYLLWTWILLS